MDVFGKLLPSWLLDCSLAIQTAYMEMVCAGRCVSECTTEYVNRLFQYQANSFECEKNSLCN